MHTLVGGTRRRLGPALAAALLLSLLLAGCTTPEAGEDTTPAIDPEPGNGVVSIWMSPPAGSESESVAKLRAVPRFVSFHAADDATAERLNDTAGYVGVATGWTATPGGWDVDEWPASAEKDWLKTDIWFQDEVPAGDYEMIRIEFLDGEIVIARARPELYIGNAQPTTGNMRLSFYPAEGETFQVVDGEELVLGLETMLVPEGDEAYLIR